MEKAAPHPFMRGLVPSWRRLEILAMDALRLFGGEQWLSSLISIETQYFYALLALLAPWVFITFPSKPWKIGLGRLVCGDSGRLWTAEHIG